MSRYITYFICIILITLTAIFILLEAFNFSKYNSKENGESNILFICLVLLAVMLMFLGVIHVLYQIDARDKITAHSDYLNYMNIQSINKGVNWEFGVLGAWLRMDIDPCLIYMREEIEEDKTLNLSDLK